MHLAEDVIIAGRYQLVDRLGSGAMGEVWRAQDTRFESRTVAVKVLREDESLKEDAINRDRLKMRADQHAAKGSLSVDTAVGAIASALGSASVSVLKARVEERSAGGALQPTDVVAVFDEFVNDPASNENARLRAKMRRLFKDEANSVANLRHDNIVSIFDYGDHEGCPFLVMDFIEGRTLYQVIKGEEPLSLTRRLRLIEDLCAGLGYAHQRKLVHRDIKPANLIIDNGTDRLKILDFGVVRRLGAEGTVGVPVGTFCYMSPEQTRGAATLDHRSDIFAVGLVFYELLSGRKAFPPSRSIGELVGRIQNDAPPPLREIARAVPPEVDQIVSRAIAKRPEDRYQDLAVMEREIARIRTRIEAEQPSDKTVMFQSDSTVLIGAAAPEDAPTRPSGVMAADAPQQPEPPPPARISRPQGTRPLPPTLEVPRTPATPPPSAPANRPAVLPPPASGGRPAAPVAPAPAAAVMAAPPLAPPPLPDAPALPVTSQPAASVATATPPAKPAEHAGLGPTKSRSPMSTRALGIGGAVAAVLLIGVVAFIASGSGESSQPSQATPSTGAVTGAPLDPPAAQAPAATDAAAVAAVTEPGAAALTTIVVDLRPWARVRVVPAVANAAVPAEPLYTPFSIDLPPGDYTLECENGGLTRAASLPLTVVAGVPQTLIRSMPGFNATKIVDGLLAQND